MRTGSWASKQGIIVGNMFKHLAIMAVVSIGAIAAQSNAAAVTDVVQSPSGFFVPTDAQKFNSPYYRSANQDWAWQHGAIAAGFTTANLSISAFDVDFDAGEIDNIYADDNGTWVLLGALAGADETWSYGNTFSLGSNFFDDIATGLKVRVDISVGSPTWFLTLGKSVLTTDGAPLPPVLPGIPEPSTWAMLIAGFGLVGAVARRRRSAAVAA